MSNADPLSKVLARLDSTDRRIARRHLTEVELRVGERVTSRGELDPAVAWVQAGEIALRIADQSVFTVIPGGVVGGEDVYGAMPRTFTAIASTPARVAIADLRALDRLRERVPPVAATLELGALRTLSAMVRQLDRRVIDDTRAFIREHHDSADHDFPLLASIWDFAPAPSQVKSWSPHTLPPILADLPLAIRDTAEDSATGVQLEPGQVLVREGQHPDGVYLVVHGRLQALAAVSEAVSIQLAEVGPNSIVGTTSVLLDKPHVATVVAIEPVTAVRLEPAVWMGLLSVEDPAASALRQGALHAMSSWVPPIRDRVECSKRCLRGVIHSQLFSDPG